MPSQGKALVEPRDRMFFNEDRQVTLGTLNPQSFAIPGYGLETVWCICPMALVRCPVRSLIVNILLLRLDKPKYDLKFLQLFVRPNPCIDHRSIETEVSFEHINDWASDLAEHTDHPFVVDAVDDSFCFLP